MPTQPPISETDRIADQLHRFYAGLSWLGPSLKDLTGDIEEPAARDRSLPHAHTIWEIVLHITAWLKISRQRLSASEDHDPSPAEDWPPIAGSWPEALSSLEAEVHALEHAIRAFPEERLPERAPARETQSFYQLLHGVIQHSAYHAGQIALLKKPV